MGTYGYAAPEYVMTGMTFVFKYVQFVKGMETTNCLKTRT